MNPAEILEEIEDCMERCHESRLSDKVGELLEQLDDESACQELAVRLNNRYNTYRADSTAKLMEVIIHKRPGLAQVNFPDNYFFRLAVIRGSIDLYDCFIEEVVEPSMKDKDEDAVEECYSGLLEIAENYHENMFPKYALAVKGRDFNGAYSQSEENPNAVLINYDDYEVMDNVVERYNEIVGRREILRDLVKRMGLD